MEEEDDDEGGGGKSGMMPEGVELDEVEVEGFEEPLFKI